MRTEGRISKVAVCPKCNKTILACHIDYLNKATEKEFTELFNEGFELQLETAEETRNRNFGDYEECKKHNFPEL